MTQRATVRAGDLHRLLKAAKAHGYEVVLPNGVRLVPGGLTPAQDNAPSDPLDSELAEWASRHGYG